MRFMNLIKSTEYAGFPPKALLDAIAKFGQEATAQIPEMNRLVQSLVRPQLAD
jgi:hypothetical protein